MKYPLTILCFAIFLSFFCQSPLHAAGMSIHQFVAQETYATYGTGNKSPLIEVIKNHHSVFLFASIFPDIFYAQEEVKKGYDKAPGQASILLDKLNDKTAGKSLKKLMERIGFTKEDLKRLIDKKPDANQAKIPSWASYGGGYVHHPDFLNNYIKEIVADCKGNAAALLLPENGRRLAHFLGTVNHIMTDTLFDRYFLQWVHEQWGKNQTTPNGNPYQISVAGGTQTWTDLHLDFVALKRKMQIFYETTDPKILAGKLLFDNSPIDADQDFLFRVFSKNDNFKNMKKKDLVSFADAQYYAALYQRLIAIKSIVIDPKDKDYPAEMQESEGMVDRFPKGLDYFMYPEINSVIDPNYYKRLFAGKNINRGGRVDCTKFNREILDQLQTILFFENRLPEFSRTGDWPNWTWEVKGVGKTLFQKGLAEIQKALFKAGEVSKALYDSGLKAAGEAVDAVGETGKKAGDAAKTTAKKGVKEGKKLGKKALDETKKTGEAIKNFLGGGSD